MKNTTFSKMALKWWQKLKISKKKFHFWYPFVWLFKLTSIRIFSRSKKSKAQYFCATYISCWKLIFLQTDNFYLISVILFFRYNAKDLHGQMNFCALLNLAGKACDGQPFDRLAISLFSFSSFLQTKLHRQMESYLPSSLL